MSASRLARRTEVISTPGGAASQAAAQVRQGFGSRLLPLGVIGSGDAEMRYDETERSVGFRADAERIGQA